jgi:hypothetical protein
MSRRDEPALWRLFDATVRAEYERALTLAKQIGPLPTAPGFVNRYRWLLRHDPGLPDASPAARREAGSAAVSLRRRDHASPISGTPSLRTRYTAAHPLVMSLEPAGDSALTAIRSGTQQFVADPAAGRQ